MDHLKDSLFGFDFIVNYFIYFIELDIITLGIDGRIMQSVRKRAPEF
jgi:hypothetical protein